ncbi:hypothetical protein [Paraburkholderia dipogonis]|uniref:hypothetical protein n=1 Tax=Paraburkholderia dipogonis TaxID=1211383 RepID=UPI0038BB80E2
MANDLTVQMTFAQANDETESSYLQDARSVAREIRVAGGTSIKPAITAMGRREGGIAVIASYVLPVAQAVAPILGPALGAWLQSRAGRKLRLKVGDLEVEARTLEEIDQLLQRAQALQAGQEDASDEA